MNWHARALRKLEHLYQVAATGFRIRALQRSGAAFGRGVWFQGRSSITIQPGGRLVAGNAVFIGDGVRIEIGPGGVVTLEDGVCLKDGCVLRCDGTLTLHAGAFLNTGVVCECKGVTTIGERALLAPQVHLYDFDHGTQSCDLPIMLQPLVIGSVTIGPGAWLCAKVTVTRDVRVGEGSVVGANAVVLKDIPDYVVAAGIPARVLRPRRAGAIPAAVAVATEAPYPSPASPEQAH